MELAPSSFIWSSLTYSWDQESIAITLTISTKIRHFTYIFNISLFVGLAVVKKSYCNLDRYHKLFKNAKFLDTLTVIQLIFQN